jgi:hypothetical protein
LTIHLQLARVRLDLYSCQLMVSTLPEIFNSSCLLLRTPHRSEAANHEIYKSTVTVWQHLDLFRLSQLLVHPFRSGSSRPNNSAILVTIRPRTGRYTSSPDTAQTHTLNETALDAATTCFYKWKFSSISKALSAGASSEPLAEIITSMASKTILLLPLVLMCLCVLLPPRMRSFSRKQTCF